MARSLQKNDPRCKDAKVYVLRTNPPYSTEFYLGKDQFVWHIDEDPWLSLKKAKEQHCILMLTDIDIKDELEGYDPQKPLHHSKLSLNGRELAGKSGVWHVYLPEKEDPARP